jgi:hypothetical protein
MKNTHLTILLIIAFILSISLVSAVSGGAVYKLIKVNNCIDQINIKLLNTSLPVDNGEFWLSPCIYNNSIWTCNCSDVELHTLINTINTYTFSISYNYTFEEIIIDTTSNSGSMYPCSDWSECINGTQHKTCTTDTNTYIVNNNCITTIEQPLISNITTNFTNTTQSNISNTLQKDALSSVVDNENPVVSPLTGAAITNIPGTTSSTGTVLIVLGIIILIGVVIAYFFRTNKT